MDNTDASRRGRWQSKIEALDCLFINCQKALRLFLLSIYLHLLSTFLSAHHHHCSLQTLRLLFSILYLTMSDQYVRTVRLSNSSQRFPKQRTCHRTWSPGSHSVNTALSLPCLHEYRPIYRSIQTTSLRFMLTYLRYTPVFLLCCVISNDQSHRLIMFLVGNHLLVRDAKLVVHFGLPHLLHLSKKLWNVFKNYVDPDWLAIAVVQPLPGGRAWNRAMPCPLQRFDQFRCDGNSPACQILGGNSIFDLNNGRYANRSPFEWQASKFGMNQVARWGRARKSKSHVGSDANDEGQMTDTRDR